MTAKANPDKTGSDLRWPQTDAAGVKKAMTTLIAGIDPQSPETPRLEDLTAEEISFLLYAETACVDCFGMLERDLLNEEDKNAMKKFILTKVMSIDIVDPVANPRHGTKWSHRVTLNENGWALAHTARRQRAARPRNPNLHAAALSLAMDEDAKASR